MLKLEGQLVLFLFPFEANQDPYSCTHRILTCGAGGPKESCLGTQCNWFELIS